MSNIIRIIGAGFSGAIIARQLSEAGYKIDLFDERGHVAGNCYSERDIDTNIMVHKYGPHIFHTNDLDAWEYVNKYSEFENYINHVKANVNGEIFSLPINLHTINQFFSKDFTPKEAEEYISLISEDIENPLNFEDQALKFVGKELYEAFFKEYTTKQWGVEPKELPASILKRLPLRFNYNDNYFNHIYQGIPKEGYTQLINSILDHENINLFLGVKINPQADSKKYLHTFYSGQLDAWFEYKHGRLPYRTLDFVEEKGQGDLQGAAVINYPSINKSYTRITEHKHFSPWEKHEGSILFKEYSRSCNENDIPYYPVRFSGKNTLLGKYIKEAKKLKNISFVGRLATFRYIDMDVTVSEALRAADVFLKKKKHLEKIPVFFEGTDNA